jgi:hypothetical protein
MSHRAWSVLFTLGVAFASPSVVLAGDNATNNTNALHHDATFGNAYTQGNANWFLPNGYPANAFNTTSSLPNYYANPTTFPGFYYANQSSLPTSYAFTNGYANHCWPTQSTLLNTNAHFGANTNNAYYANGAYPNHGWLQTSSLPAYTNTNSWFNATPCSIPGVGGVYTPFFSAGQSSIPGLGGVYTPFFSAGQSSIPGMTVQTPWFSEGQSSINCMGGVYSPCFTAGQW